MLSCPSKYFTGFDCPGCGFQRSVFALIKGNFAESFHLYPGTVMVLLFVALTLLENAVTSKLIKRLRTIALLSSVVIIGFSYLFKLYHYASA